MTDEAWSKQAESLIEVQKFGKNLEGKVRKLLGWQTGRLPYDSDRSYDVQADCVYPTLKLPSVVASITYSDPDTPGHSNENKLQLKLGELALLKNAYPEIVMILILGGTKQAWLPYVIEAFKYFFDEVLFLWEPKDVERLESIKLNPNSIKQKHKSFWDELRKSWLSRKLSDGKAKVPTGLVRYGILDLLKRSPGVLKPSMIKNEIARACMQASLDASGKEWGHYLAQRWSAIEMSRNYFNPVEASVDLSLKLGSFSYEGGLAKDVEVDSFLHLLGMAKTKLSEDFILFSEKLKCKVYIQCKSSGGGRKQHGKNIQNRTKEQVARSILYTAKLSEKEELTWKDKTFHWIGVVDGEWGVTRKQEYKYVHMLEMAGYDKIICANDLVDENLDLKKQNNPLIEYLAKDLKCKLV